MSDPLARFRVQKLTPDNATGRSVFYQLTNASTHPTRIVGRDRLGRPIEETITINSPRKWATMNGCINSVPMRTHPNPSSESDALAYEQMVTVDLLQAGWIPLDTCPYSPIYRAVTGTPYLIDNPTGIEDCGGKPDGCEHLQALMSERKVVATRRFKEEEMLFEQMSPASAGDMIKRLGAALDVVNGMAGEPDVDARRTRLARGKGE